MTVPKELRAAAKKLREAAARPLRRRNKERRALVLAGEALRAALNSDWPGAVDLVAAIGRECGGEGVQTALLAWSDTLIAERPSPSGLPVHLVFWDAETCGRVEPECVPDRALWAGRMLAARAAEDKDMWFALLDALPDDPAVVGSHVGAVLETVALGIHTTKGSGS